MVNNDSFSSFIKPFKPAMKPQIALFTTAFLLGAASIALPTRASEMAASPVLLAQYSNPVTYTTLAGNGQIAIQITDGNFRVHTYLQPDENGYIGEEEVSRIYLNPLTGQVIVTSTETGRSFTTTTFRPSIPIPASAPMAMWGLRLQISRSKTLISYTRTLQKEILNIVECSPASILPSTTSSVKMVGSASCMTGMLIVL
jgi:hypothetical protein